MIKVGIIGGASPQAGELIRILINHPDVKLCQVCEPKFVGADIKTAHHGLIGECSLNFVSAITPDSIDVLFVADNDRQTLAMLPAFEALADLRIINMVADFAEAREQDPLTVYGVPEVNRKALVRGARKAVIPPAVEVLCAVAMLPLALRSMLPAKIDVTVTADKALWCADRVKPRHISGLFALLGNDCAPQINFRYEAAGTPRAMRLKTEIALPLPLDNIIDMYGDIYDDHNLTCVVGEAVKAQEVEGTDKCIITLDKTPAGLLSIQIAADARLRGGAGDAVHVMNLLTGLYEKTGLALKASAF